MHGKFNVSLPYCKIDKSEERTMMKKYSKDERGPTNAGWLQSMHTFSFGHFYDPNKMGFGALRVINEDTVQAGAGFGTHPHRDMEIVSYVLDGALEHKDSMGNGSIIKPGDIQRMSAGTGVTHSEFNYSGDTDVHFLQIWFLPEAKGIEPGYEQKSFSDDGKKGALKLVMSQAGRDGSVKINQDIDMLVGLFEQGESAEFEPLKGRIQWVQVAKGEIDVNGEKLVKGDGLAIREADTLHFSNAEKAEIIVFDMVA